MGRCGDAVIVRRPGAEYCEGSCVTSQQFETPKYMVMVFELMEGGDLFHYLSSLITSAMTEVRGVTHLKLTHIHTRSERRTWPVRDLDRPGITPDKVPCVLGLGLM